MVDGKEESINSVQFLKTNSGKKGEGMPVVRNPQFYFREGLCWSDINTTFLKCRKKEKSIHDVKSMSIFGVSDLVEEDYIITLINSTFISYYVDNFVNNTQTFQINDARQLPVVISNKEENEQAIKFVAYRSFRVFFRGFLWHIPNCILLYINTLKHVAISR